MAPIKTHHLIILFQILFPHANSTVVDIISAHSEIPHLDHISVLKVTYNGIDHLYFNTWILVVVVVCLLAVIANTSDIFYLIIFLTHDNYLLL